MKKIALIPALLVATLAFADQYKYEISPMIGYNFAEGNLDMKGDGYYTGGLEAQMNVAGSQWSPELSVFYTKGADYTTIANNNTNVLRIALNGVYTYKEVNAWVPFVKFGVGHESISNEVYSNTDGLFVDAGAGAKIPLTDSIAFKLEAIYMAKLGSNNAGVADSNLMALAGFSFAFGKEAPKAAPVVAAVDGDDDNDGVLNRNDQCLNTPAGEKVDSNGCRMDDDNDGVFNSADECPTTQAGVSVDVKGCKVNLDNDNDGVLNDTDLCPTTPAGEAVNVDGCPLTINLHVNFDNDSAVVKKDSMQEINKYANFLTTYTNYSAKIIGYTDSRGAASYNQKLSQRRAEAVKETLIEEGVSASQLSSEGMGEANPVADNATREGRAQNRRIEAELTRN